MTHADLLELPPVEPAQAPIVVADENLHATLEQVQTDDRWTKNGGRDATERAGELWRKTLEEYEQPAIDEGVRGELRDYVARRRIELGDEPVPTPAF